MMTTKISKYRFRGNSARNSNSQASYGKPHRRGAAIVEFSLVMPIILLFFTTMIELSRVLMLQHTADTAAYEAARSAMVPGGKAQDAHNAANSLCEQIDLPQRTSSSLPN